MRIYFKNKIKLKHYILMTLIMISTIIFFGAILPITIYYIFNYFNTELVLIFTLSSILYCMIKRKSYIENLSEKNLSENKYMEILENEINITNQDTNIKNIKKEEIEKITLINYYNRFKEFPTSINDTIVFKLKSGKDLTFNKNEIFVEKIYNTLKENKYEKLLDSKFKFRLY
jgi:hypothetical protein